MPIGVVCGKKEIMEYADTKGKKKSQRSYIGGGTFSANPATMAAGFATLYTLKNKKSIYTKINSLGETTRKALNRVFDGKVITTGKGSLFMTHFLNNSASKIVNASDASKCNTNLLHEYHLYMIANDKIFFLPGKLGAYSNAHSKSDMKKMISTSEKFSESL